MAKTTKSEFTGGSIFSEIDFLSDKSVPNKVKAKIKREVGEFLVDETLLAVSRTSSPVIGGKYKASLSPEYAKEKREEGLPAKANMEFSGDMLDALTSRPTANGIRIGIFGNAEEAVKADSHNDFSGSSRQPPRHFLPREGQKYKASIDSQIEQIVNDNLAEAVKLPRRELRAVQTKSEFFSLVGNFFPGLTRGQISTALRRSPPLVSLLTELNLLRFIGG